MEELPIWGKTPLDGYRLIRFLGRGGFGEVWLCRSEAMGDYRALKWIPATGTAKLEREYEALLQYRKSAGALRSPYLLAIEHVGRTDAGLYYIMPLADGVTDIDPADPEWRPLSLTEKLNQQAQAPRWFSSTEVIDLMTPILDSLQLLTDAGLVHRDVKPDNILFFHGIPCLGDISLLRADSLIITQMGTPLYLPPAWYVGGYPDMYSLAATFYTVLTGNPPDMMGRSSFLWPSKGEASLAVNERVAWKRMHQLIRRAREEKVSERFMDFRDMARALREVISEPAPHQPTPPPLPPSPQAASNPVPAMPPLLHPQKVVHSKRKSSGVVWWTGGLLLLGIGGWVILVLMDPSDGTAKNAPAVTHAYDSPAAPPLEVSPPVIRPDNAGVAPSAPQRPGATPAVASPAAAFTPPKVDRSPRDHRKASSTAEDARLAYNSLSWFTTYSGKLTASERNMLEEKLLRIGGLIRDQNNPDFEAAAGLVDSCMKSIPPLRQSPNARLAKIMFLYCGGNQDQADQAESDPAWLQLGDDELAYRVELMDRLRMDPGPLLDRIIASPASGKAELVRALMERARFKSLYAAREEGRQDVEHALELSASDSAMRAWVEQELADLRRGDEQFARALQGLPQK